MTENTPTPAELRTRALELPDLTQQQIDEAGDSFGSAYDQIAGPGETYTAEVMAMKLYELGWLPPRQAYELRAQRDAIAAIFADFPHDARCYSRLFAGFEADPPCSCFKSKLPADALAARDAERWQEGYDERTRNMERWHEPSSTERMYWPDSENPYRIKRAAQR